MKFLGFHITRNPLVTEKVVEKVVTVEKFFPATGIRDVFVARSRSYAAALNSWHMRKAMGSNYYYCQGQREPLGPKPEPPEWHESIYLSCAQAFEAHGADVELIPMRAFIDGGSGYLLSGSVRYTVNPKPKVAKGKK